MTAPTRCDSLSVWLEYLAGIHSSAIDMGLERVLPVFEYLNIQKNAFVFTVAGTNGKGSTTATIAQICQSAGLKTALYQSPHLVSFNERIRLDGQMVSDETLIDAFVKVEQARVACHLSLSFFEMTTLAALLIFAQSKYDVWVLEVGLGGRLDVVNVIDPDVCVITNVAIDHTDWLGDTCEKIGFEKAGILRQQIPLIYGQSTMPKSVLQAVNEKNVVLYQKDKDFSYQKLDNQFVYSSRGVTLLLPLPTISLDNASVAVSAILASGLAIDQSAIKAGLRAVKLAGRFDVRSLQGREWVFDVAHNVAGVEFLLAQFIPFWQEKAKLGARLHAVFSMLADKDIDGVLQLIKASGLPIVGWYIAPLDSPRTMSQQAIYDKLAGVVSVPIYCYDDIHQAVLAVTKQTLVGDGVLVFGSFHTIGESLIALNEYANPKIS